MWYESHQTDMNRIKGLENFCSCKIPHMHPWWLTCANSLNLSRSVEVTAMQTTTISPKVHVSSLACNLKILQCYAISNNLPKNHWLLWFMWQATFTAISNQHEIVQTLTCRSNKSMPWKLKWIGWVTKDGNTLFLSPAAADQAKSPMIQLRLSTLCGTDA